MKTGGDDGMRSPSCAHATPSRLSAERHFMPEAGGSAPASPEATTLSSGVATGQAHVVGDGLVRFSRAFVAAFVATAASAADRASFRRLRRDGSRV